MTGRVGELHPALLSALDLRADRIVVAEVSIEGLAAGRLHDPGAATPSRHPVVERDLAIVVGEATPAADVEATVRRHGGPLLRDVDLFDIYRGRPLGDAEKSLAYRLTLRGDDRTLTEAEVDAAVAAITAGLQADIAARLRT